MGRTNGIILALGLLACVALSLTMKYALSLGEEKGVGGHPVLRSLDDVFGNRLEERSAFVVEKQGDKRIAVLTIHPRSDSKAGQLAQRAGALVWRLYGSSMQLEAVDVVTCLEGGGGERRRMFQRARPQADEPEPARPTTAQPPASPGRR